MKGLPQDVFVAVFDNGDVALCKKIVLEHRTRYIALVGRNGFGKLIRKDIPKVDWDFYLSQKKVRVLNSIETEGFVDAIRDVYESATGKKFR